jgi:Cu-processing system ATP-binding protein
MDPGARRSISFLPQKVAFPDSLTGCEVIEFHRRLRGVPAERATWALNAVGLWQAAKRAVSTYSGGMLQRLGLAVAALAEAPVLLLDEPTASLDPEGLSAARAIIERRRNEGGSALFTSHQLADVEELADRVAVLVEGRLAAELTRAQLVARLSQMGILRLRLDRCPSGVLERLGDARWDGGMLCVPGTPERRAEALELVHKSGARVESFASEDGRLDGLYRELVGASP